MSTVPAPPFVSSSHHADDHDNDESSHCDATSSDASHVALTHRLSFSASSSSSPCCLTPSKVSALSPVSLSLTPRRTTSIPLSPRFGGLQSPRAHTNRTLNQSGVSLTAAASEVVLLVGPSASSTSHTDSETETDRHTSADDTHDHDDHDTEPPRGRFARCIEYILGALCQPACQMGSVLCCFGCLTCFGCRDKVCQKLMYFPPPPCYSIEDHNGQQTLWLVDRGHRIEPYTSVNMHLAFIRTRKSSTICTLWLRQPGATTTVLFSHGNATDIGCMRDHLVDFAKKLQVNVLTYDYTGYGRSSGLPTMSDTLADSEAAYDYLMKTYPSESRRVIVYGQSLGSGPTLHLSRTRRVSGVVVHSGFASAMRVLEGATRASTRWFDVYPNIDLIRSTRACVFIVHGVEDQEIAVAHGRVLAEAAPNSFKPWFVQGAGHNNIEVDFRQQYFMRLTTFVRHIEATTNEVDETQEDAEKSTHCTCCGGTNKSGQVATPPPLMLKDRHAHDANTRGSAAVDENDPSSSPMHRMHQEPAVFDHVV